MGPPRRVVTSRGPVTPSTDTPAAGMMRDQRTTGTVIVIVIGTVIVIAQTGTGPGVPATQLATTNVTDARATDVQAMHASAVQSARGIMNAATSTHGMHSPCP